MADRSTTRGAGDEHAGPADTTGGRATKPSTPSGAFARGRDDAGGGFDATGLRALELAGSTFYLRDGLMQVWLAVLADTLSDDTRPAAWKWRLEDDIRYQATIVFDGLLVANIDAHLTTVSRLREFVAICRDVRRQLDGPRFEAGSLAARVGAGRWDDRMAPRLVRVTDAVLWLAEQAGAGACGEPDTGFDDLAVDAGSLPFSRRA